MIYATVADFLERTPDSELSLWLKPEDDALDGTQDVAAEPASTQDTEQDTEQDTVQDAQVPVDDETAEQVAEQVPSLYQDDKITRLLTDASAQMDVWAGGSVTKAPAVYTLWCCEVARFLAMQTTSALDEQASVRLETIRADLHRWYQTNYVSKINAGASTPITPIESDLVADEARFSVQY